jgi:hypothetical protein
VVPELVPAEDGHRVACHLLPGQRREIFAVDIGPKL